MMTTVDIRGTYVNKITNSYRKPTAGVLLLEMLKVSLKYLEQAKDAHSHTLFNINWEVLTREIGQEKEMKGIHI
jgi:hypothetical protein